MTLSIQEYEQMRFRRSAACLRYCNHGTSRRIHEWADIGDGFVFGRYGVDHEVATVMSIGMNAKHYIFVLEKDGSLSHAREMNGVEGFIPFDRKRWDAVACRCCQHDLIVVERGGNPMRE